MARECIKKFHTLGELLAADPQKRREIGISRYCTVWLKLMHELPIQVLKQKVVEQPAYTSSQKLFDYLYYSMRSLDKEVFKVIFLNEQSHILDIIDLFTGTKNQIPVSARGVIESALGHNASYLVLVHNHTSGDPKPSKTDIIFTRDMAFIGTLMQITVLDHIIIGDNRYFSFADEGLLQQYKDSFYNMKIKGILAAGNLRQIAKNHLEATRREIIID